MKRFTYFIAACILSAFACQAAGTFPNVKSSSLLSKTATPSPRLRNVSAGEGKMKAAPARADEPGQWSEWSDFGEGTLSFLDPFAFSEAIEALFYDHHVTVQHRVNATDSDQQQFLIKGLFEGHDIIADYVESTHAIKIAKQSSGIEEYGEEYLFCDLGSAYADMNPEDLGMTQEELDETAAYYHSFNYFIPSTGEFYIYCGFYSEMMGDMVSLTDIYIQLDGYGSCVPVISVEEFMDAADAKASIEFSENCTSTRYCVFPGTLQQYMLDGIMNGSKPYKEIKSSGEIELTVAPANTFYSVVAITYDGEQPVDYSWAYYTPVADESDSWKSLGEGKLRHDFFESMIIGEAPEYAVEVQESLETPGLYRVVNPLGEGYPYNFAGFCETEYNHYMIVDATSENVELRNFDTGFDMMAGNFLIISYTDYYRDYGLNEQEIADSGKCGSLNDGVITFPANSFMLWCPDWENLGGEDNAYYYSNPKGDFKLTLPTGSAVDKVESTVSDEVEYFNLQGISLGKKAPEKGLYLERQGEKVTKIIR